MLVWSLLVVQALIAMLGLRWWRQAALPNLPATRHPELILDVWGPIALILPLLFAVRWVGNTVEGTGWLPIGAPILCGAAAAAFALIFGDRRADADRFDDESHLPLQLIAASVVAGLALLLLGAAHTMTVWIGQCAFALAAIILWINTPDLDHAQSRATPTDPQHIASMGMLLFLMCSIGQGVVAWSLPPDMRVWSAILLVASPIAALALTAWHAGQVACIRLGIWAATLGVLFALGLLALSHMMPRVLRMFAAEIDPAPSVVARGFGAYALEATLLLVLAVAIMAALRLPRGAQVALGTIGAIGILLILLVRLASPELAPILKE
ncbi:MAG TPA: hypothetical protein PK400_11355 [Phycisphaerales bacterium]|nr:hypothetical protein [Phycisphaerales bacterium]HRQ74834.1 hypothetical protein [Phycisphaerales bacterium]